MNQGHRQASRRSNQAIIGPVRRERRGRKGHRENNDQEANRRDEKAIPQDQEPVYKILQFRFLSFFPGRPPLGCLVLLLLLGCCVFQPCSSIDTAMSTALANTSSTPRISLLLHSTYVAPIRCATALPCSGVMGVSPWVLRSSMHVRLVRRSDFRPTRMMGVVGQKCRTSGYHCDGR